MSELLPNNTEEDGNKKYEENRLQNTIASDDKNLTLQDQIDSIIRHRESTAQLIITIFKDKQYHITDVSEEQIIISDKAKSVQPPVIIKVQHDFGIQRKDQRDLQPRTYEELDIIRYIQTQIEKEQKKGR